MSVLLTVTLVGKVADFVVHFPSISFTTCFSHHNLFRYWRGFNLIKNFARITFVTITWINCRKGGSGKRKGEARILADTKVIVNLKLRKKDV